MKKEILNFGKMVAIAIAVITTSCSKEISEIGKSETIIEEMYFSNINDNDELVLGRKLDNPYALENMQKAMDIIAKSSKRGVLPDRISPQKKLKPTHRYVVFLPKTKLHLEILTDLVSSKKMVSSIYPFDYEIIKYGKNYTDVRTKDKDYPVLYASVPVSEKIPNVPYEKLQDLYLTTENDDKLLETSALFLAKAIPVTADNQVARPNPITSYEKELEKYLEDEKAFANIFDFLDRSYHPQGIVRVQNSNGEYVPLRNAEIKLRSWFTNDYCTTDSNGRFYCESPCKTDKNVFITWDYNSVAISTDFTEIIDFDRSDNIGVVSKNNNGKTYDILNTDRKKWSKATVHNAIGHFKWHLGNIANIEKVNIWLFHGQEHSGMAPMMKRYNLDIFYPLLVSIAQKNIQYFLFAHTIVKLGQSFRSSFPDVVLNIRNYDTEALERLVFHELAHVIHSQQVGGKYWGEFAKATLTNILSLPNAEPYGNGTQPTPFEGELIALCEGWANFLEHTIMARLYSEHNYSLERFTMYSVPTNFSNGKVRDSTYRGWFLHGLMWDIVDSGNYENFLLDEQLGIYVWDEVPTPEYPEFRNGQNNVRINEEKLIDGVSISISHLFKALSNDVKTGKDLRQKLKDIEREENPYSFSYSYIGELFKAYGF